MQRPGVRRRDFLTSAVSLGTSCLAASAATRSEPGAVSDQHAKPFSREHAAKIIANARRIVTPNGVERLETVRIGGIEQWVSVRGRDKRNPVLLFIHGGPGYASMPMSWWFTRGWEDYFTVVQWDQRGAGKTYLINDPAAIAPTMTLERMIADAEEMLRWAGSELGKSKVFVAGHSWGSFLGLELAKRHPGALHAYIGVGQLTNGPESERRGWRFALDAAKRAGNSAAVRELEAIAPYFPPGRCASLEDIYTQRRWLDHYGGTMAFRQGNSDESDLVTLSPDYTDAEIARIWEGNEFSERHLLRKVLCIDQSATRQLLCPVLILAGRHDFDVSAQVAAEWFAELRAPYKRLVWFEDSGHLLMTEAPGRFLDALLTYALPMASQDSGSARPSRTRASPSSASAAAAAEEYQVRA
jgi:proline iminopeptidase